MASKPSLDAVPTNCPIWLRAGFIPCLSSEYGFLPSLSISIIIGCEKQNTVAFVSHTLLWHYIIQPIVISKIKRNKNKKYKRYLNDSLLTSIAGISAAMKNTG